MVRFLFVLLLAVLMPGIAMAEGLETLEMTGTERGIFTVLIFIIAYAFVMTEEFTHMRKSKPVILAAGIIWAHVSVLASQKGVPTEQMHEAFEHDLKEYAELMLFLLVAMTYINSMAERNVFEALRSWLVRKQFGYRQLF